MSSLQLPPSVIHQMDRKRRAFLWSGDKSGTSSPASCLVAWIHVCYPKELGGLGVKDLGLLNICLMLKLIHRLHCPLFSAWARWAHGDASVASLSGQIQGEHWDTLRALLPLYQAITTVVLGDGKTSLFWSDVWLGDEPLQDLYLALYTHCSRKLLTVSEMISTGVHRTLVNRLSPQAYEELQCLNQSLASTMLSDVPYKRISVFCTPHAGLDSGAIYEMLKARGQQNDPRADFIWKSSAPPRVKLFMWLLLQKRIQCRAVLFKKRVVSSTTCEICNLADESPEHIMFHCAIGNAVWNRLNLQSMISMDMASLHTASHPGNIPAKEFNTLVALICWQIWKARNAKIFRNESTSVDQVLSLCKSTAELWKCRLPSAVRATSDLWCSIFMAARQGQG